MLLETRDLKSFLDPRSCHELLGDLRSGHIGSLPVSLLYFQLEAFLHGAARSFEPDVGSIPERLILHNLRNDRNRTTSEMAAIDADVVYTFEASTRRPKIEFKPYFQYPEFERPIEQRRVVLHILIEEAGGIQRSVSVPLQTLMPGWGDVADGHQGYNHSIAFLDGNGSPIEQWNYVGITSRNWLVRMEEHFQDVRNGSNKRFHAAWRTYAGDSRVVLGSELVVLNHTKEGIMAWEEEQVDVHMKEGRSLNMIPGGLKGLRFLHEHRLIPSVNVTLEERENAITEYAKRHAPQSGVPNLLLAKLWRSDDFYLKVLAGRTDVLTPAQVCTIRRLAETGLPVDEIALKVAARNIDQVKRVIAGKTYRRIGQQTLH